LAFFKQGPWYNVICINCGARAAPTFSFILLSTPGMGMNSWDVSSLLVIILHFSSKVQKRLAKGKGNLVSRRLEAFGAPVA
jgi:hypothetical protein